MTAERTAIVTGAGRRVGAVNAVRRIVLFIDLPLVCDSIAEIVFSSLQTRDCHRATRV